MIIRLFLGLFFAALIFLIIADIFYELHLGALANLISQFGDDVLLLSFALLLISGAVLFSTQLGTTLKDYFSAQQRAQRQLFFSIAQNRYLQNLFNSQKKQFLYFAQLKREKLLAKNNKNQCRLLAKSILKELQQHKNNLPVAQFKHYQQAIKQADAQQQIQQLLELQHEISTL